MVAYAESQYLWIRVSAQYSCWMSLSSGSLCAQILDLGREDLQNGLATNCLVRKTLSKLNRLLACMVWAILEDEFCLQYSEQ